MKLNDSHYTLTPWQPPPEGTKRKKIPILELYETQVARGGGEVYGWRLISTNNEIMCGAFNGKGFDTARAAWLSATRCATYLSGSDLIPLANISGSPARGTDFVLTHPTRGPVLRIRRAD